MRTARSRCCTRWRSERPRSCWWKNAGSATCRKIVKSGFSDAIGSCRITAIRRPRTAAARAGSCVVSSSPSKIDAAAHDARGRAAGARRSRGRWWSCRCPTRPRDPASRPRRSAKLTPSTALTTRVPPKVEEVGLQTGHLQDGSHSCGRALQRFRAGDRGGRATSRRRAGWPARSAGCRRPGNTVSHHWPAISVGRASESIRPHAGWGGGTPTPRKLSDASAMMTTPTVRLASTVAVFMTLGRMCRLITRSLLAPAISASFTNSRSRRVSTSPRMTRA